MKALIFYSLCSIASCLSISTSAMQMQAPTTHKKHEPPFCFATKRIGLCCGFGCCMGGITHLVRCLACTLGSQGRAPVAPLSCAPSCLCGCFSAAACALSYWSFIHDGLTCIPKQKSV